MMINPRLIPIVMAGLLLSACQTFQISVDEQGRPPVNDPSTDPPMFSGLERIKKYSVQVGSFSFNKSSAPAAQCSSLMQTVQLLPPKDSSYDEYFRKGFTNTLRLADIYSTSAPVSISGVIEEISLSNDSKQEKYRCAWNIKVTLVSTNGNKLSLGVNSEEYILPTNISQLAYDTQFVNKFGVAVEKLTRAAINHPEFYKLLTTKE